MRRGEIWSVDLEPTHGREQAGRRPVLIVSPDGLNAISAPIVCPITAGGVAARMGGFTVPLIGSGTSTTGVVLCHQVRVVDLRARHGRRVERVPDFVLDDVLARLATLFE